ncbi:MAG: D-aminoacylase [Hydrogenoanaerobacterium sp.]
MFDLLIKNGTVADGSGVPVFKADVAVTGREITAIAPRLDYNAKKVIDARGKLVTPGFIDIHRHADVKLFTKSFGEAELRQGLTTIVNGNCGLSCVPCPQEHRAEILSFLRPVIGEAPLDADFESFTDYMDSVKHTPLPLNVGMCVGNGTVRAATRGYATGKLSVAELVTAQGHLREALEGGALGVTLGIVYAPEYNYSADDFVEVLQPMREYDVPLVTHIRGEGDLFHRSLYEVIGIAKRLGVRLHISHFKCIGKRNWGHGVTRALQILDEARASGLEVDCDVYPYTAGSTQLIQILPPSYLEGGVPEIIKRLSSHACRDELREIFSRPSDDFENLVNSIGWENIRCTSMFCPESLQYLGKSVAEIAQLRGEDPCDTACNLLVGEECNISMVDFITAEEDVRRVLCSPLSSVISDAVYPAGGVPHPRLYAAFPKVLTDYVRKEHILPLETAINKMTAKPAGVYRLPKKGLLKVGFDADINIFALENLSAPASYEDPMQFCGGFDYIFVNGRLAVEHDKLTQVFAGGLLKRQK